MKRILAYILATLAAWFLRRLPQGPQYLGVMRAGRWDTVRDAHVKGQPACAVCGTKSGVEVHHVRPYHLFPELELDPTNLITLCREHHLWWGHLGDFKSWNPEVRRWIDRRLSRPYTAADPWKID